MRDPVARIIAIANRVFHVENESTAGFVQKRAYRTSLPSIARVRKTGGATDRALEMASETIPFCHVGA
jgi:hypothetical protein